MNSEHPYKSIATFFFAWITCINLAAASEADIPNTFSAGTPAKAAEVNENFNAVKAAVDDNHASITRNTEDVAANTNAISEMQQQRSQLYLVDPTHVNIGHAQDAWVNHYGISSDADYSTSAFAPVNLPQGAIIIDMDCLVLDLADNGDPDVDGPDFTGGHIKLLRYPVEEGIVAMGPPGDEILVDIPLETTGADSRFRKLVDEDGVVEYAEIDNLRYIYAISYSIRRSEPDLDLIVSRCRITYQH